MNNYILRIKQKSEEYWNYVNSDIIASIKDIKTNPAYKMSYFMMKKDKAKKLARELTMYRSDLEIEQLAISEIMEYSPYRERNVVLFREFNEKT